MYKKDISFLLFKQKVMVEKNTFLMLMLMSITEINELKLKTGCQHLWQ